MSSFLFSFSPKLYYPVAILTSILPFLISLISKLFFTDELSILHDSTHNSPSFHKWTISSFEQFWVTGCLFLGTSVLLEFLMDLVLYLRRKNIDQIAKHVLYYRQGNFYTSLFVFIQYFLVIHTFNSTFHDHLVKIPRQQYPIVQRILSDAFSPIDLYSSLVMSTQCLVLGTMLGKLQMFYYIEWSFEKCLFLLLLFTLSQISISVFFSGHAERVLFDLISSAPPVSSTLGIPWTSSLFVWFSSLCLVACIVLMVRNSWFAFRLNYSEEAVNMKEANTYVCSIITVVCLSFLIAKLLFCWLAVGMLFWRPSISFRDWVDCLDEGPLTSISCFLSLTRHCHWLLWPSSSGTQPGPPVANDLYALIRFLSFDLNILLLFAQLASSFLLPGRIIRRGIYVLKAEIDHKAAFVRYISHEIR